MSKAQKKYSEEFDGEFETETQGTPELKVVDSVSDIPELPSNMPELSKVKRSVYEIDHLKGEKERIERQCRKLQMKLVDLNHQVEETKGELLYQKDQFENDIRRKQNEIVELEALEEDFKQQVHKLKLDSTILEDELTQQKKMAFKEIGEMRNEKDYLEEQNRELKFHLGEKKRKIESLDSQEESKSHNITKLEELLSAKQIELEALQSSVSKFSERLEEHHQSWAVLEHKKTELEEVIKELSLYEDKLTREKELAFLKLEKEIQTETQRFEYDRKIRYKQLSERISEKEGKWHQEFEKKKYKLEGDLNKQKIEGERKYQKYLSDLEFEKDQILNNARSEGAKIKKEAEELLSQAYAERQRLLDEGSHKKMEAVDYAAAEIKSAREQSREILSLAEAKREEAEAFHREKIRDSEIMINSARSRSSLILQNAEKEKKALLFDIEKRAKESEEELSRAEEEFQSELSKRRERFKSSLDERKERFEKHLESMKSHQDYKLKKNLAFQNQLMEKTKRKELKKLVHLKEDILEKASHHIDQEKEKLRDLRKRELEDLYHMKKELLKEKESLEHEIENKYKALKKAKEKELLSLQKVEEFKHQSRRDELEEEFEKRSVAKEKELQEKYRGEDKQIRQALFDYIIDNFDSEEDMSYLKKDIAQIFENKKSEQKDKILKHAAHEQEHVSEKNMKTVFWRYGVQVALPLIVVGAFGFDFYGVRTTTVTKAEAFLAAIKKDTEKADQEFVQQVQEQKVYHPKMTPGYKDSYVENVLHTESFMEVYESDEFQNDWLLEAYGFISNELELPEELAINFVSSEGALIKELSDMKKKIDVRFLDNELQKMRQREEEVMKEQASKFLAPENWKAFQAFRDQFYQGKIK